MEIDVLVAEIGSTTTLVNGFTQIHTEEPIFFGQGQALTSIDRGDVRIGLQEAMDDLCAKKGIKKLTYREFLATSSAAGGLKMTVHGLVYDMTARAAKEAALGAGAVVKQITGGKLDDRDLETIEEIQPNLILIAGGVDGGEQETALCNSEKIRSLSKPVPIVYAGNRDNREKIKEIFEGWPLYLVDNVYPQIDVLHVDPCRRVIRKAFEDHITRAPGMAWIRELIQGPILPTPGAVMLAAQRIFPYLGDLMVLDVGGATTDVHSVTEPFSETGNLPLHPEPQAKRTVEGDLGLYLNRVKLVESMGEEVLRASLFGMDLEKIWENYPRIPRTGEEMALVGVLAQEAIKRAVTRHSGQLKPEGKGQGKAVLLQGKDLTRVQYMIGTGGALTRLNQAKQWLAKIPDYHEDGSYLLPTKEAKILLDHDYIMASLGALSQRYPRASIKLLEKSLGISLSLSG